MGHHHDFSWNYQGFNKERPMRIGIGGPVGSGKTALVRALSASLNKKYTIGVITNDIYTKEDEEAIKKSGVLPDHHVIGVETGGCPHTAIREDVSMNMDAVEELERRIEDLNLIFIESGGDNLAAAFSPELVDIFIYVIDVAQGDDIPRKGGPGLTQSDLLVVNKTELAPYVRVDLDRMKSDAIKVREGRPTIFANVLDGTSVPEITQWVEQEYSGKRATIEK